MIENAKEQASGLKALGSKTPIPTAPSKDILETFPNSNPERLYAIEHSSSEFSSMCPLTGQPDFASYSIRYIANKQCVESKSLKLLMGSFRNTGAFMEKITNEILTMLVDTMQPRAITVEMFFQARGGIGTSVRATHVDPLIDCEQADYCLQLLGVI